MAIRVSLGVNGGIQGKKFHLICGSMSLYPTMTYDVVDYNVGIILIPRHGILLSPSDGIYTFNVAILLMAQGMAREIAIYLNSVAL